MFSSGATSLFGPVPNSDVRSLAGPVVEASIAQGTELVHENEIVGTFSVILAGRVEWRERGGRTVVLGEGTWFGELDPMRHRPAPATVTARSAVRLLTFSAFGIERLCAAIPGARERILARSAAAAAAADA